MGEVRRIYPEGKTALINWIEQYFHEINSYVFACQIRDKETGYTYPMTVHDFDSFVQALGVLEVAKESICTSAYEGDFHPRGK